MRVLADSESIRQRYGSNFNVPNVIPVKEDVTLKRHLGVFSGVCFIIGIIIGSGIFVSPKGVLRETESVGLCLIIWVACGLVSLLGALCFAEIGNLIPRNGAEIAYMKEGSSIFSFSNEISTSFFSSKESVQFINDLVKF